MFIMTASLNALFGNMHLLYYSPCMYKAGLNVAQWGEIISEVTFIIYYHPLQFQAIFKSSLYE